MQPCLSNLFKSSFHYNIYEVSYDYEDRTFVLQTWIFSFGKKLFLVLNKLQNYLSSCTFSSLQMYFQILKYLPFLSPSYDNLWEILTWNNKQNVTTLWGIDRVKMLKVRRLQYITCVAYGLIYELWQQFLVGKKRLNR